MQRMALRKENFDDTYERARAMENKQQHSHRQSIPIEISGELYDRIELAASLKHLTVRQYLEYLLDETIPKIKEARQPGHPITRESIERLREFREQLFRENNYQFMGNSVEELREAREERTRQLMGEDYSDE
jgi:hypothetical protein